MSAGWRPAEMRVTDPLADLVERDGLRTDYFGTRAMIFAPASGHVDDAPAVDVGSGRDEFAVTVR